MPHLASDSITGAPPSDTALDDGEDLRIEDPELAELGEDGRRLRRSWEEPGGIRAWLTSVDHKSIGRRYLVTALVFFAFGGALAIVMRAQLGSPELRLVDERTYDELFSMHGITMIFLFITPAFSGFGNFLVPLMIGARDMAFPRLNALSYWLFLFAGIFLWSSVLFGTPPSSGWFNYVPLGEQPYSPGRAVAFYALGLAFVSISTTLGAVNFIVTIARMRAPGMSVGRMPVYVWAILVTSFVMLFALPVLSAGNLMLWVDRSFGGHWFDATVGGQPLLWQHVFWAFGHPDVYLIFIPATGIVSTIIPAFSRRPIVGYVLVVVSVISIGMLAFGVWAHHMFAAGLPSQSMAFFAGASLVIAVPSGIQIFAWIATMILGRVHWRVPMLYAAGFLVVFTIGGVTGVMFPAVPADLQVTDTYFVVAHFHYVLVGGAVFPMLAGLVYWFPKMTGRMLHERFGAITFWVIFVGFNLTFFPMHISGLRGMPRRVATYLPSDGVTLWNRLSTIGAVLFAIGLLMGLGDIAVSLRRGRRAGPDPWRADTLEWATTSPPRPFNFARIPRILSRHPLWDESSDTLRGQLVLPDGHQALGTTSLEAGAEDVLDMPRESWSPLLLALAAAGVFYGLLLEWPVLVGVAVAAGIAAMVLWHARSDR